MPTLLDPIRAVRAYLRLPAAARGEHRRDRAGLPAAGPSVDAAIEACAAWVGRAQDRSATGDGGVARHFSLVAGWGPSYPETTGYLIPTMLAYAGRAEDRRARDRARRMADWLVRIQLANGAFQGGTVDARPIVPVTFNTGQILLGLASAVSAFGEAYRRPMLRAADWLVATQDPDGCWRRHPTPFAAPGEKVYETHVAWGLLEAARIEPGRGYAEAALANIRWALKFQRENGWFDRCCLTDPAAPLTHTMGYALRGVIEGYRFSGDAALLAAARRTADGLADTLGPDGFLAGRLHSDWSPAVEWSCLTGTVQLAACWLLLYADTRARRYRDAAFAANGFVRRTISVDGPDDVRGAIKGSFPISGGYGTYQYLNWAAKFFLDSHLMECSVREAERRAAMESRA